MRCARPSSLAMGRLCKRSLYLSALHNESRPATRLGSQVDSEVSLLLANPESNLPSGEEPLLETEKILTWVAEVYPPSEWEWYPQRKVELVDPVSGELLTKGTADLVCRHRTLPKIAVVDWKSKGQMWAGHLAMPDKNPQVRSYLAGAWLEFTKERPVEEGEIVLVFWDHTGVTVKRNLEPIDAAALWQIVDEVRAVPAVDLDASPPEASVGDHCLHCYQRQHCDAHLAPAGALIAAGLTNHQTLRERQQYLDRRHGGQPAPVATEDQRVFVLPGFEEASGPITEDSVRKAMAWVESVEFLESVVASMRKQVQDNIDAFVTQAGPVEVGALTYGPVPTPGRRMGATVSTLEKMGLTHLIREGKTSIRYKWYRKER